MSPRAGRTPPKEIRSTSDVEPGYRPTRWELRDFALAWVVLSVAFWLFFVGGAEGLQVNLELFPAATWYLLPVSFLTVGLGVVCHELAHRTVAVWFGRAAAFRAHYGLLVLGLVVSLAGIVLAAPGGVYHRLDVPPRERGLIALAGPASNLALGVVFAVPLVLSIETWSATPFRFWTFEPTPARLLLTLGLFGVPLNLLLAGFNMLPVGPLDGGKVYMWHTWVYLLVAVPSIVLGALSAVFIVFLI